MSVHFTPNGDRIISLSWRGNMRVSEAETGREILVLDHGGEALCSALSADGRLFAVGLRDGTIRVYQIADWTASE